MNRAHWFLTNFGFAVTAEGVWYQKRVTMTRMVRRDAYTPRDRVEYVPCKGYTTRLWRWPWKG